MYRVKEESVASENTEERYYSSWYVYDGLVYCLYQGRHNASTSNLTYRAHVN